MPLVCMFFLSLHFLNRGLEQSFWSRLVFGAVRGFIPAITVNLVQPGFAKNTRRFKDGSLFLRRELEVCLLRSGHQSSPQGGE